MLAKKKYETSDVIPNGNQIKPIAINHTGSSATTGAMAANADVSGRRRDCSTESVNQKLASSPVDEFSIRIYGGYMVDLYNGSA